MIHFINCPVDLSKAILEKLFEIKAEEVDSIAEIERTNGVYHTLVTFTDQAAALKMFDKYVKDNVWLFREMRLKHRH